MSDDQQPSVTDDAVSNRSDDTALDDGEGARANGRETAEDNKPSFASAAEKVEVAEAEKVGVVPADPTAAAKEAGDGPGADSPGDSDDAGESDVATEEDIAAAAAEEAKIAPRGPIEEIKDEPEDIRMDWYILKVQSNRERTIAEALERKMKIEGYERFFDQAIVPTEKVTEFKAGKKKVVERKLYPGYIVVHMHINDDTWFAVRETAGVGDFTGAGGKPTPMLAQEVAKIIHKDEEETSESPKLDIKFTTGDKVKVKEGNFESFEGEVNTIDEASGRVTVMINIFGRSTPVELEYWQIEAV
jgi:transcription termination/antitermination protein NusG